MNKLMDKLPPQDEELVLKYLEDHLSNGSVVKVFTAIEEEYYPLPMLKDGSMTMSNVESYGGEDMGSTYYTIYKFAEEGQEPTYVKFEGWYSSYEGTTYFSDALKIVKPVEKTIIAYEEVK